MSDTPKRLPGMERRTVLRAGAVAWSVPTIVAVAAVPAFACSPVNSLVVGTFTVNYRNGSNAGTVDPTRIDVTSAVTNTGTQATGTYIRTLTIPANLFDTVSSTTPVGYGAPTITGGAVLGSVKTLSYVRTVALAAGATDTFGPVLTLGNTASTPFRGWQGPAFTLGGTVNGGATCNVLGVSDLVEATPNTTLTITGWAAGRNNSTLTVGDSSGGTTTRVSNTGRKAVGPITLSVEVPRLTGRYSTAPAPSPTGISSGWVFVGPRAGNGPWTYTFQTSGSALAPDGLNGGDATHVAPAFQASISLTGPSEGTPGTANIRAIASAAGANNSAQAINNAE